MYTSLLGLGLRVAGAYGFCPGVAGEIYCSIDFLGQALRDQEDEMRESGSTQRRELSPWALQADRSGQEVPVLHCTCTELMCIPHKRDSSILLYIAKYGSTVHAYILFYVVFSERKM
jgi:hypothetical protein